MTDLPPLDLEPIAAARIRDAAHRVLHEQSATGPGARLDRTLGRWVEPPLVASFATGILLWALQVVLAVPLG